MIGVPPSSAKTDRTLGDVAALARAELDDPAAASHPITGLAALDLAGPRDLTFFDNPKYEAQLQTTRAGACLVQDRLADRVPAGTAVLRTREPYPAFVAVMRAFYADRLRPASAFDNDGVAAGAVVHPSARLEDGVIVDPGAIIGPRVEIGKGSLIGSTAVIGAGVKIGRDCSIGAGASVADALIGNHVIIHPGCRIGQDGFGYLLRAKGHVKVPQIGRVIIQNDVEIGAGTTIDRGAIRDTVIGEGTKIDNLVQIGHNVVIGRHCVIVAQTGISGSATLEDGVVLGARVGVNNHAVIGAGAQIAAMSVVRDIVPPGAQWGGFPAKPMREWFMEVHALSKLAQAGARETRRRPDSEDNG